MEESHYFRTCQARGPPTIIVEGLARRADCGIFRQFKLSIVVCAQLSRMAPASHVIQEYSGVVHT